MITVRMKQRFSNKVDAIRTILEIAGPENETLFEYVGKESKRNKKDTEQILKEELVELGLEESK